MLSISSSCLPPPFALSNMRLRETIDEPDLFSVDGDNVSEDSRVTAPRTGDHDEEIEVDVRDLDCDVFAILAKIHRFFTVRRVGHESQLMVDEDVQLFHGIR